MLVCSVSMHPRRQIASEITEAAAATDEEMCPGNIYRMAVDEPAFADETSFPFLGEILSETASAADTVSALAGRFVGESATAASTQDATVTSPTTYWNPADTGSANVILSGGNLVYGAGASHTTNDGCRATVGLTTGKHYFELTAAGPTTTVMLGVGLLSSSYPAILSGSGGAFAVFTTNGHIWNDSADTTISIGAPTAGDVYCFAIDLTNKRGWIRKNGGNWNNSGTANPATNTGGQDISWLTTAVYPLIASNVTANPIVTANFGATTFAQTVPSGFTAWP